jgi:hypothetical protein
VRPEPTVRLRTQRFSMREDGSTMQ